MRQTLEAALGRQASQHFGHAYQVMAPAPEALGKPDVKQREDWLQACAGIGMPADYPSFFARWKASFPADSLREVKATSRLLIGHGNPSGADVGLTVHHTWGVPMLPGSALKGVLAHYIDAVYGHEATWRGPTLKPGGVEPSGCDFRILFGAPPAGPDDPGQAGLIEFHDALYVPGSAPENKPFALDVLTVHQKEYYNSNGASWPNDWDSPNPVGFISVRRDVRFLLAVTIADNEVSPAAAQWRSLALKQLLDALDQWGVGGKTAAGYGRLVSASP